MTKITKINGDDYRRMLLKGFEILHNNEERINSLNVFPVPDGDTGSNMTDTVSGILSVDENESLAKYAYGTALAMMRASRGNSGVILSLFFSGVSRTFAEHDEADAELIIKAFKQGAVSAASAVANPVEGTILTVMRECCSEIEDMDDLREMFAIILDKAEIVLAKTPEMLPALKKANVVDSGGQGFVCLLKGMKLALNGEEADEDSFTVMVGEPEFETTGVNGPVEEEEIKFAFCTECLLETSEDADEDKIKEFAEWLPEIGDSIVFVHSENILKFHVHTNVPLEVFAKAQEFGTFTKCKIENMRVQHTEFAAADGKSESENEGRFKAVNHLVDNVMDSKVVSNVSKVVNKVKEAHKEEPVELKKYAVIAACAGKGLANALQETGIDHVITCGKTQIPSTGDILKAAEGCAAETVFVLPNNKNAILAAKQAAAACEVGEIRVIDTRSVPEGIAAAMAFNEARDADQNQKTMQNAAKEVVTLSFSRAIKDAEADGFSIKKKQYMGLAGDKIEAVDETLEGVIEQLINNYSDCELFTVYYGHGVKEKEAERIADMISLIIPDADVECVSGGQKIYSYIISAE